MDGGVQMVWAATAVCASSVNLRSMTLQPSGFCKIVRGWIANDVVAVFLVTRVRHAGEVGGVVERGREL
jgi:hypothetical protein